MTWMLTSTGQAVDLRFIGPECVSVLDIAHHLSQLNRYTGAAKRPYSVAEHSLLVCEILERERGERDPQVLLAALMHDAHEAYTADLSTPMKAVVGEAWRREEKRVEDAVLHRFGLQSVMAHQRDAVRWADLTALSTERDALLPPAGPPWPVTTSHPPITWWDFDARAKFTWTDWRSAFMDRFAELHYARTLGRQDTGPMRFTQRAPDGAVVGLCIGSAGLVGPGWERIDP